MAWMLAPSRWNRSHIGRWAAKTFSPVVPHGFTAPTSSANFSFHACNIENHCFNSSSPNCRFKTWSAYPSTATAFRVWAHCSGRSNNSRRARPPSCDGGHIHTAGFGLPS